MVHHRGVGIWNDRQARCLLIIAIAAGCLIGCGYHLRTWDLAGNLETARITANQRNPLTDPLGRALTSAGVTLVDAENADLVIELLSDRTSRRNVAVTSQARVAEYEATMAVQYAVRNAAGDVLVQPTWLRASRVYRVDRGNPVASSQEQTLLEREMVTDLVQQLIRGVNAAVASGSATTSGAAAASGAAPGAA